MPKSPVEKIKEKIIPKKDEFIELTPALEQELRLDERIKFAQSFNFQSLFANTETPTNWLQYLPIIVIILELIILWKK